MKATRLDMAGNSDSELIQIYALAVFVAGEPAASLKNVKDPKYASPNGVAAYGAVRLASAYRENNGGGVEECVTTSP